MNKIIIDIPEKYLEPLQNSFYDVETYRTVLVELINNNDVRAFEYNIYDNFREDYKKALITYDKEKINFEFDFVLKNYPTAYEWNATFGDGKVEILYS